MVLPNVFPDYQTIVIGNPDPQNQLLDPQADRPVSQLVLETFNIPFRTPVLGSNMPGFDIHNLDAITALKLSLVGELVNNRFAEVEIDEFGFARFYAVGETPATNLDIRFCVETSQITNEADLVIVRGYDPPPRRELRPPFDGLKNKELFSYADCAKDDCDSSYQARYTTITYDDPQLDQTYLDDIQNSYELNAFETLIGYLVDLDMPDQEEFPGLKITFGNTTREFIELPDAKLFNPSDPLGPLAAGIKTTPGVATTKPDYTPLVGNVQLKSGSGDGITFKQGTVDVVVQSITEGTVSSSNDFVGSTAGRSGPLKCQTDIVDIAGTTLTIDKARFVRVNKFGIPESDFLGVREIIFRGHKVTNVDFAAQGLSITATQEGSFMDVYVKARRDIELVRLDFGKNWIWEYDESQNPKITIFSILEEEEARRISSLYVNPWPASGLSSQFFQGNLAYIYAVEGPTFAVIRAAGMPFVIAERETLFGFNPVKAGTYFLSPPNAPLSTSTPLHGIFLGPPEFVPVANIGDANGYLVLPGMCLVVERARPSIDIFEPSGRSDEVAEEISLFYTPIVVVDEPAPIAFASIRNLVSEGGRDIGSSGIIDQTDGIVDSDPSTSQDFSESEIQILQDNTTGATLDITLAFLNAAECLIVAQNLLSLQNEIVNTKTLTLGPNSTPHLGDVLPDGSIINEINYSYSDSSQYLISVTAGPKFLTAGAFNQSNYQLQTEEVTREGLVIQDAGNGGEYVVRVPGLGEYTAVSLIVEDISVGDRVSLRIFNNPVESL